MSRRLLSLVVAIVVLVGLVRVQRVTWADTELQVSSGIASQSDGQSDDPAGRVEPQPQTTAGVSAYSPLPSGLVPFLEKPFRDTYDAPVKLHSFFDHQLPIYWEEALGNVPADLRDTHRSITRLFTGESRTEGGQGYRSYSGHNGMDYGDRQPAVTLTVLASANGVIARGAELAAGCSVYVNHDASQPPDNQADYSTYYTHLSSIGDAPPEQRTRPGRNPSCGNRWCQGDTITKGAVLGTEGNDPCGGSSDGVHLHFGVAAGSMDSSGSLNFVDPFGWWSNDGDPWADTRLEKYETNYWLWAAPIRPEVNQPGYWGDNVAAQTDDSEASFHRFTALSRELQWIALPDNPGSGIDPVGSGAWRSTSLVDDSGNNETWAVWALHVPDTTTYRVQVHIPETPGGVPSPTTTAKYQIRIPQANSLQVHQTRDVDQNRTNEWVDLVLQDGTDEFDLNSGDVVLIRLGDVIGRAGETVLFDAVRLYQIEPSQPPVEGDLRRVGFAIDNSSSMLQLGKINVVRDTVPPWIDLLETSPDTYTYALVPFANNVPAVSFTENPEQMKSWVADLDADNNDVPNNECPEASLGAIQALAPQVSGGDILLFTDDLPLNALVEGPATAVVLARQHAKLHAIILPKTCSGGNALDWLTYRVLVLTTGGTYQSVSNTARTEAALQIVLSEMEANVELSVMSGTGTEYRDGALYPTVEDSTHSITVDSTMTEARFLLNVLEGSFSLALYRPDGSLVSSGDPGVTYIDSGSAQYYRILDPPPGTWQANVAGNGEYVLRSSGKSDIQFTYLGDTYVSQGQPMQLAARLSGPVSAPAFKLETPTGEPVATVPMYDAGTLGDYSAGDGVYTGLYTPNQATDLRMSVTGTTSGGQAFTRLDSSLSRLTSVVVQAHESISLSPGEQTIFQFAVTNTGNVAGNYRLTSSSSEGWIVSGPPSQISLNAGETKVVPVRVVVSANAIPNMVDIVRLTATHSSDAADLGSDVTNVFVPAVDESSPDTSLSLSNSLPTP